MHGKSPVHQWVACLAGLIIAVAAIVGIPGQHQRGLTPSADMSARPASAPQGAAVATPAQDRFHRLSPHRPDRTKASAPPHTLVFYDADLPGLRQELEADHTVRAIALAPRNPLTQIVAAARHYSGLRAIHIVSHGEPGAINLAGTLITGRSRELSTFRQLRASLAPNADILLYGCNLGEGPNGRAFVRRIARLTGADVAAADGPVRFGTASVVPRLTVTHGPIESRALQLHGWTGQLWTSEVLEGGWWGDLNVPVGQPANNPKADPSGYGRLTTMGDMTQGGSDTTFSVATVGFATANTITHNSATPASYAEAVTAGNYFKANLVAGGTLGIGITRIRYNQVSANAATAQLQPALYDTVTGVLAPLGSPFALGGSGVAVPVTIANPPSMLPGRLYELRWYAFNCGSTRTCYFDNPELLTSLNEPPVARNDSFTTGIQTTLSGNLVTSDNGSGADSDPENQTLAIDRIDGAAVTVGSPISLANGTLTISNAAGAFSFAPAPGFFGTQTFAYRITDGFGYTATATVTITVASTVTKATADSAVRYGGGLAYPAIFSVRANDTIATAPATAANSTLTALTPVPAQLSFDTGSGNVSVLAGAPPGTYQFTYKLCSAAQTYECASATASVTLTTPMTVTKSSAVFADQVNLTTDPKAIPGALIAYTITLSNPGALAIDNSTLVIVDTKPPQMTLRVGNYPGSSAPINAIDGSPASGLTFTYSGLSSSSDDVDFSNDNGLTWTYVPVANAQGLDPAVTAIRLRPKGAFGANRTFALQLMLMVN